MIDDVQAFLDAWLVASKHEAAARPDAAIQLAMRRLGLGVLSRVVRGSKVDVALKPFSERIGKGREARGESDPATIAAWTLKDGDRYLVSVSMGFASAVFAFDRGANAIPLPSALAWSYRLHGPLRRIGKLIVFDAVSIQDAGVRYAYRLSLLRRTAKGYVSSGVVNGTWTYGDESEARLVERNGRLAVKTLDEPTSFFTSSPERALRRIDRWDLNGTVARRVDSQPLDLDLRAADAWLYRHRGQPIAGGVVPKDRSMMLGYRRRPGGLDLDLDGGRFSFSFARRGGKPLVVRVAQKK